jgi:diguanylate cyclase (GGDEF)-like protein
MNPETACGLNWQNENMNPLLMAKDPLRVMDAGDEFMAILNEGNVRTVYQPIISLKNGSVLGFEALSRGPRDSRMESPTILFDAARMYDKLWELELLCRIRALENAAWMNNGFKIFLNVDPDIIHDEKFRQGFTKEFVQEYGINPENIVFEVTEKRSISDLAGFRKIITHYKDQGYKIAVDDAGAGYSGLNMITDIHPHFIKLDMNLIRDIDKTGLKYALVRNFNEFCQVTDIRVIAEGIETENELNALIDIGIEYGQGYLIQRPSDEIKYKNENLTKEIIKRNRRKEMLYRSKPSTVMIGDICSQNPTIRPDTSGDEVKEIFTRNPALAGLPVCESDRLTGLVMRDKFFAHLGTQYGYTIFSKRPIRLLMDNRPLEVDVTTTMEATSRLITARNNENIYDIIVVTRDGAYHGVISVKDLLQKTMEIEVNHAKHLNPLTGLPGNMLIEHEIKEALESTDPFTLLYIDIDNFKAYNDVYGFENGDRVLLFLRDVLEQCMLDTFGTKTGFLGHIGGDDFVLIPRTYEVEHMCHAIVTAFKKGRNSFYNEKDNMNGFIKAKNRRNEDEEYGLMTLCIAGINNQSIAYKNVYDISERVTTIKKECKSKGGDCVALCFGGASYSIIEKGKEVQHA